MCQALFYALNIFTHLILTRTSWEITIKLSFLFYKDSRHRKFWCFPLHYTADNLRFEHKKFSFSLWSPKNIQHIFIKCLQSDTLVGSEITQKEKILWLLLRSLFFMKTFLLTTLFLVSHKDLLLFILSTFIYWALTMC